jgi:hypothetical protein
LNTLSALPVVHAMHWNNIDPRIIRGQAAVFNALEIPLKQHPADRMPHGDWMNSVIQSHADNAILVFVDIDAFPITKDAYLNAIEIAQAGGVFGLAQFSNHKPTNEIYAGPMFAAFSKKTWQLIGSPSFSRTKTYDAGESLTASARENQVPVHLIYPTSCLVPKWALGNKGVFGLGTFYGNCEFFHLFESSRDADITLFSEVVKNIVNNQALDFSKYLNIINGAQTSKRRSLISKIFRG